MGVACGLILCLSLNNRPYTAINFSSVTVRETSCVHCDSYYFENEDRIACAMKRTERTSSVENCVVECVIRRDESIT
jgi:hypothetical protein